MGGLQGKMTSELFFLTMNFCSLKFDKNEFFFILVFWEPLLPERGRLAGHDSPSSRPWPQKADLKKNLSHHRASRLMAWQKLTNCCVAAMVLVTAARLGKPRSSPIARLAFGAFA
jgi:hypothetical protein